MVRRADIKRIRENFEREECREAVALWRELCEMEVLCKGADPEYGTYDLVEYLAVEAKALKALL